MLKKKIGIVFLACIMALVPLYADLAFAETAEELRARLTEIEQRKQELETRKADAKREAEVANVELDEVLGQLRGLQAETSALQRKTDVLQGRIDVNQAKLAAKRAEIASRHKIYKKRLRDIYINGQVNYLDVLLGAKDFSDFSSRMYLLQSIVKSDLALIEEIQAAAAEISERQKVLDAEMREMKASQAALDSKKARITAYRRSISRRIAKAEQVRADSNAEIDRLEASSNAVTEMLRNLESSGGSSASQGQGASGSYVWPCRGEITSYFGWRTHPIFGTTKYHSGMDIAVDTGTPIHATNSGIVVYSGWLGGYGYCVMIDHGGGLVSLYGHNSGLNCSEGQYVSRGAVIAYAGSTGYSTGPHCHFEMRLHGEVTEPLNYLP